MSVTCCNVLQSLTAPDEMYAIVTVLGQKMRGQGFKANTEAEKFCYGSLNEVSRSFAGVVMQLDDELREVVCIFYLVLRALDTIEDDMRITIDDKRPQLLDFYKKLDLDEYSLSGIGFGHEALLLENYTQVLTMYKTLSAPYQAVIKDITRQMGEGMSEYLTTPVTSVAEYNKYCFYVAGLVGHGLSDLWSVKGHPTNTPRDTQTSMGLFLQKVNIIRDYLEDITDEPPRCYWPQEIWGKHAEQLADFTKSENIGKAVECLDEMIGEALSHVEHVLRYLGSITDGKIFVFCAIPQVMAVATLAALYGNSDVFRRRVKIRKGVAAIVVTQSNTLHSVLCLFKRFLSEISLSVPKHPTSLKTKNIAIELIALCEKRLI
eukprot:TRINITY_DN616_c9_g1_i1.p1 TRINITY_DN616_c9_g1~~TRINITY_DN616_c9_g1_i1.p1  ORF type:complete len:376 (+),score=63.26 TRINITY_DN616_c9_g1_i1:67-1194(+)